MNERNKPEIIKRSKVVTIEYTLKNENGEIIERNPELTYLHGFKNIISGLEEALEGRKVGDSFSVSVPPEKGYGFRDPNMVFTLPKENFKIKDEEIKKGIEFETVIDNVTYILTVIDVNKKGVTVDANHPLAGKPLFFEIKITDIREPFSDEVVQGFPLTKESQ